MLRIVAWAVPIGAAGALAAPALLRLIGLLTNLVFYQRISTRLVAPGVGHHQPLLIPLAPVAGGLARIRSGSSAPGRQTPNA